MSIRGMKAVWLSAFVSGVAALTGCVGNYADLVDPCWPERYNCKARESVIEPMQTQAGNGLALEQTVFNHYFEDGSEVLLPGGRALLVRLARRRPMPEPIIYVQAANDRSVLYSENLDEIGPKRNELNEKRVKAVTEFLKSVRPDVAFTVAVHDPSRVGMDAQEASMSYFDLRTTSIGNLQLQGAGGAAGGQGGGGGGGGQGGGGGGGGAR